MILIIILIAVVLFIAWLVGGIYYFLQAVEAGNEYLAELDDIIEEENERIKRNNQKT